MHGDSPTTYLSEYLSFSVCNLAEECPVFRLLDFLLRKQKRRKLMVKNALDKGEKNFADDQTRLETERYVFLMTALRPQKHEP